MLKKNNKNIKKHSYCDISIANNYFYSRPSPKIFRGE